MDAILLLFVTTVGGIILYLILSSSVKQGGKALQRRFISLGNMTGMLKADIVKSVGMYKAEKNIPNGSVCTWQETGYMITLVFDINNKCVKKASEIGI